VIVTVTTGFAASVVVDDVPASCVAVPAA